MEEKWTDSVKENIHQTGSDALLAAECVKDRKQQKTFIHKAPSSCRQPCNKHIKLNYRTTFMSRVKQAVNTTACGYHTVEVLINTPRMAKKRYVASNIAVTDRQVCYQQILPHLFLSPTKKSFSKLI